MEMSTLVPRLLGARLIPFSHLRHHHYHHRAVKVCLVDRLIGLLGIACQGAQSTNFACPCTQAPPQPRYEAIFTPIFLNCNCKGTHSTKLHLTSQTSLLFVGGDPVNVTRRCLCGGRQTMDSWDWGELRIHSSLLPGQKRHVCSGVSCIQWNLCRHPWDIIFVIYRTRKNLDFGLDCGLVFD